MGSIQGNGRPEERIRAVLFDFDGTLADTTELIMRSYRHTMTHFLGAPPPDEEWLSGFGTPLDVNMARYARSTDEHSEMVETYRAYQELHHDSLVRPFPGAVHTVQQLARQGVQMAIVTSKYRQATLRGMELCGLIDHIDVIVTPEDVTHAKPHPEPVRVALDRLGVEASAALFVGDSPHDIASGRAAATRTAAALWGPFPRETLLATGADYFLTSVERVIQLVDD